MDKEKDEVTFNINGNPGQGNTFVSVNVGKAINVINNPGKVENNYFLDSDGELKEQALKEGGIEKPDGKKLGHLTVREMLRKDMIDTTPIQMVISNYVSCIRPLVKDELVKTYDKLWLRVMEHEAFVVDLYDPGKQQCTYNRNLVANIIHYLDGKGFYKDGYNSSAMARALEDDDQHPIRKALRYDPDDKYCKVVEEILESLKA